MTNFTTFVIQEHHAEKAGKHWDFRIKYKGVLKSWAIPKCKFPLVNEKILAIEQPDHQLVWQTFQGEIKEGYGKGTVKIYDSGKCTINKWTTQGKKPVIDIILYGKKVKGSFVLIKFTDSKKNWILLRKKG